MARMAKDIFVGIDAGTTGSKVALFDARGNELGTGYCEYPCTYPHPGWVEQDVEEVWRGICRASRAARAAATVADDAIRSVGFSSQRGSFILLDEREHPLAPAVLWNDSRAKEMERVLTQRIAPERYRSITGMPVVLLQYRECTVLGASILGAVGCGYFASIHEAVQSMVKVGRTVEPDPATADIYTQLFEVFRFCYETAAQAGLYKAIYEFQRKYF